MKTPASLIWKDDKAVLLKKASTKRGCCDVKYCRGRLGPAATLKGNKTCSKCAMRQWRANNILPKILADIRQRAKRKGTPFSLTLGYMLSLDGMEDYMQKRGRASCALHLDRKETSKGYVEGNVFVITAASNIAKGNKERHENYKKQFDESKPF